MTLLNVEGVSKAYRAPGSRHVTTAVQSASFSIGKGETVAVIGESGAGKSTLGRIIAGLIEPDEGSVTFEGQQLVGASARTLRKVRARIQMVFQDPYSSFDPMRSVGSSVIEPFHMNVKSSRTERTARTGDLLERVGISRSSAERRSTEFSGGQLQRIAIARAISTDASLIICDEPVAALDVSIRGQILNLLLDLQDDLGVSYLFISHDLSIVEHLAHRVAVMYAGEIVEMAETRELFARPQHPYTQRLLDAIPVADPRQKRTTHLAGQS